jgi:P27 family predicted phage terminase small subunit
MADQTDPKPPKHLSTDAKRFWRRIVSEFVLEDAHTRLLQHACESWDQAEACRKILADEGLTMADRFGQQREHPAAKSQRDYMHRFAQNLKALGLLDEAPDDPHAAGRRPDTVAQRRG